MICPVCNGLATVRCLCPCCGQSVEDAGRMSDFYGDYSPYRPIEDGKMTNGLPDASQNLCVHLAWCPHCRKEYLLPICEIAEGQFTMADQENTVTPSPFSSVPS